MSGDTLEGDVEVLVFEGDVLRVRIGLPSAHGFAFAALGFPAVGETLTVQRDHGPDALGASSIDYVVHERRWLAYAHAGVEPARMTLALHVHPATDPLPPYVCGECGRRFPDAGAVVQHTADQGHAGTAWRVEGDPRERPSALAAYSLDDWREEPTGFADIKARWVRGSELGWQAVVVDFGGAALRAWRPWRGTVNPPAGISRLPAEDWFPTREEAQAWADRRVLGDREGGTRG